MRAPFVLFIGLATAAHADDVALARKLRTAVAVTLTRVATTKPRTADVRVEDKHRVAALVEATVSCLRSRVTEPAPWEHEVDMVFELADGSQIRAATGGFLSCEGDREISPELTRLVEAALAPTRSNVPEAARTWTWSDSRNLLADLAQVRGDDLGWSLEHPPGRAAAGAILSLRRGDAKIEVRVHPWTSIVRAERQLFIAIYDPAASGCAVESWDLASGQRRWRTDLKTVRPVQQPSHSNCVQLDIVEGLVVARGEESCGDYVEVLDLATGERRYHHAD